MEQLGKDLTADGSVMTKYELEEQRRKRGECLTCGRKCFQKKLFKMIPITDHGKVLDGRCLNCKPLEITSENSVLPAVARPATYSEQRRFNRSQSQLSTGEPRANVRRGSAAGGSVQSSGSRERDGRGEYPRQRSQRSNRDSSRQGSSGTEGTDGHSRTTRRRQSLSAHVPAQQQNGQNMLQRAGGRRTSLDLRPTRDSQASSRSLDSGRSNSGRQMAQAHDDHTSAELPENNVSVLPPEMAASIMNNRFGDSLSGSVAATERPESAPAVTKASAEKRSSVTSIGLSASDDAMLRAGDSGHDFFSSTADISTDHHDSGFPMEHPDENSQSGSVSRTSRAASMDEPEPPSTPNGHLDNVDHGSEMVEDDVPTDEEKEALARLQDFAGFYRDVLEIMREFPDSSLVQQEALKELSNLQLTAEDYVEISALGGIEATINSMNKHMDSLEVQICGCRAVWNLSATQENQEEFAKVGGISTILTAMYEHVGDAEVQEKAMAALANLGANPANQAELLDSGGVKQIVEAMSNHSEDVHVQEKGCSAITNLAASNDARIKEDIAAHGGASAVVISMIMHAGDVDLQDKALRAVRNMCANHEGNKRLIAEVGGIDAVISAMQVHRDEPSIQEAGAWTLSNLAVNGDNKIIIGESGGIDVVVRAMWVHTDNPGVQEWCCRALWTLSVDPDNKMVVTEVGGISAVVNAMQAHVCDASVQEKGCGVLSNLAANDNNNKVRIVEEEALDAIVMAMVLHADNASVQDRACTVLRKLAYGPNIKPMQAANVGELVRVAADNFPDQCADKAHDILDVL